MRTQGPFRWLLKHFIAPLVRSCPQDIDPGAWLNDMMGVGVRTIDKYVAIRPFKVPGLYRGDGAVKQQGVPGKVGRRAVVLVRHDTRTPGVYELSFTTGKDGEKECWYELDKDQWLGVQKNLKRED